MSKRMAMFRTEGDFDIEEFYREICKNKDGMLERFSVRMSGGRPALHGETPGAQMIITLESITRRSGTDPINAKIVVSNKGVVQVFYEKTEDLYNSLFFLKQAMGYKIFDMDLLFVDGDYFDFLVSCVELRQICFVQTSCAMDANREPVHGLMYLALIEALRTIFEEIEKTVDGVGRHGFFNSFEFIESLIFPIQNSLTKLMLYLKEDRKFAKEMLVSVFKWLNQLETKVQRLRELELIESGKIRTRDEWIAWEQNNEVWSQLRL